MSVFSVDIPKLKKKIDQAFAIMYLRTYFLLQQRASRLEPVTWSSATWPPYFLSNKNASC